MGSRERCRASHQEHRDVSAINQSAIQCALICVPYSASPVCVALRFVCLLRSFKRIFFFPCSVCASCLGWYPYFFSMYFSEELQAQDAGLPTKNTKSVVIMRTVLSCSFFSSDASYLADASNSSTHFRRCGCCVSINICVCCCLAGCFSYSRSCFSSTTFS